MVQDGKPIPKVIDFGVAKAIEHRLTERTVFTEQGQLIGTPGYMSPEQAEMTGLNVDTATDVYSLGVLLYELLVGAPPFDPDSMREAGLDAIQRLIREVDPPKPSTRISRLGDAATVVAQQRRAEPATLERQLKGELDWIIMRAMEKDRNRRYTSAAEFAADVGRSLAHQPVLASPPSTMYRARKFVRRHRIGVTAGAVVMLALVLGTVGTTIGLLQARQARNEARQEAETSKQVSEFLAGVFEVSDPSEALGNTITAREILDKGAAKIEEDLADQPEVQATLMHTMGNVYRGLGLYGAGQELMEQSLQIRTTTLGPEHLGVAESANDLARLLGDQGEFDAAEPLSREALRIRRELLGEEDPRVAQSLNRLGILLRAKGDYENAELVFREALTLRQKLLGRHQDVGESLNNLANLLRDRGDLDGAEPLYRDALALWQELLGEHPVVATILANLSSLLMAQRDYDAAEPLIREALAMDRTLHGEEHPHVASSLSSLANLLKVMGDLEEAEPLCRQALAMRRKLLGEEHPAVARSMSSLANILVDKGDYEEAEPLSREALAMRRKLLGREHPRVAWSLKYLGDLLMAKGDYVEAESVHEEALAMRRKLLGEDHRHVATSFYDLACVAALQGERDVAVQYLRQAVDRGYQDAESMRSDGRLEALRGEPEFEAVLSDVGKPRTPDD
jgi:tetratricopeptide (TPR) repeat protein